MTLGMAGRLDHAALGAADLDNVPLLHLDVERRDRSRLLGRTHDGAAGHALDDGVAGGVVVVMMRDENMGQRPALVVQRGKQLLGVRRIDRGGRLGLGVVDQDAKIVAAGRKLVNLQLGHLTFPTFFLAFGADPSISWPEIEMEPRGSSRTNSKRPNVTIR